MNKKLRKVDACTYEVGNSGYFVEQMACGYWDGYLPNDPETRRVRVWSTLHYPTRAQAVRAIEAEIRFINKSVREAIAKMEKSR